MVEELGLVVSGDGLVFKICWGGLDAFSGEGEVGFGFHPVETGDPGRGDEDLFAGPPGAGCYFDVADGPGFIVDDETVDVSEFSVEGFDVVGVYQLCAAEVGISGFTRHGLLD